MARADRFTALDVNNQIYSDFLTDLNRHPVSGEVVRYINEKAVIRSIKNLFATSKGERFCQPLIGSNIKKMLFENIGSAAESEIRNMVIDTISQFEPRAKVLNVDIRSSEDSYSINLTIMVLNKQDPVSFSVTLNRVR